MRLVRLIDQSLSWLSASSLRRLSVGTQPDLRQDRFEDLVMRVET